MIVYQWPFFSRGEGSIGTIIYFDFRVHHLFFFLEKRKEEKEGVGINDKRILEHNFERDGKGGGSFRS